MRILFLHKYGPKAASYRYRFQQYFKTIERAGHECVSSSLLGDDYLDERFRSGRRSPLPVLRAALRRFWTVATAFRYDVVVVGLELAPYTPCFFEYWLNLIRVPYVYDYDDAVFHYYDRSANPFVRFFLGRKIQCVIQRAAAVLAGSPYLEKYARRASGSVVLLPTVVDLERYSRVKDYTQDSNSKSFVIGWIGSPSTAEHLESARSAIEEFCRRHAEVKLVAIGAGKLNIPGARIQLLDWSEENEIDQMLSFDVGIMPLVDDPWCRGKCGFKLIQYMACALPTIASPVGVNADIVLQGKTGFLASTHEDWLNAFEKLYSDRNLRRSFGLSGRERVAAEYALEKTAPRFLSEIEKAANRA